MQKRNNLSVFPYKGTNDRLPRDMVVRRYIFDTWRTVCEQFGYLEYQTPLVEYADLYRAKSGDEVGGKELYVFSDKSGRELAIRPEMTPSVTRMVSGVYTQFPKPLKLYNISNFMRYEKPQRGRNREFWQLNYDVFGADSEYADVEIISMAIEILFAFNPPEGSFVVGINHRGVVEEFFKTLLPSGSSTSVNECVRLCDKFHKLDELEFWNQASALGIKDEAREALSAFLNCTTLDNLSRILPETSIDRLHRVFDLLEKRGYRNYIRLDLSMMRGFDYYDGIIFEVFDMHPDNNRSMFGGGRYNGLASLFGVEDFPAVGCAPGDETIALFLETWGILPNVSKQKRVYLPLITDNAVAENKKIASFLRSQGVIVNEGLSLQSMRNVLSFADKIGFSFVLLIGDNELNKGVYSLKDMILGEQKEFNSLDDLLEMIQS